MKCRYIIFGSGKQELPAEEAIESAIHSNCFGAIFSRQKKTPLTLAIQKGHYIVAKFLVENGASVREDLFSNTIHPLEIAQAEKCDLLKELLEQKVEEQNRIIEDPHLTVQVAKEKKTKDVNYARFLDINVGDQKNTVTIQSCANQCPDIYGCHTPGGGDFHNRGYVNDVIARITGPGGFWYVTVL